MDPKSCVELRDSRTRSKEESFKRCQSVEVLSFHVQTDLDPVVPSKLKLESHLDVVLDSLANENMILSELENDSETQIRAIHKRRSMPLLFGVQVRGFQ